MTGALELTDEGWGAEVLGRREPILVDFWAPWCIPCERLQPELQEIARRFAGRIAIGRLNVDDHPRAAGRYDVLSLPTLVLFTGGREVARIVGLARAGEIEDAIAPHVA
jgi:thioredoxin 1